MPPVTERISTIAAPTPSKRLTESASERMRASLHSASSRAIKINASMAPSHAPAASKCRMSLSRCHALSIAPCPLQVREARATAPAIDASHNPGQITTAISAMSTR